jgi:hypothetical protein
MFLIDLACFGLGARPRRGYLGVEFKPWVPRVEFSPCSRIGLGRNSSIAASNLQLFLQILDLPSDPITGPGGWLRLVSAVEATILTSALDTSAAVLGSKMSTSRRQRSNQFGA